MLGDDAGNCSADRMSSGTFRLLFCGGFLESAAENLRELPYLDKKNVKEVLNLQSEGRQRQTVSSQTSARRYHLVKER
jgi:hypothetical protein